ncbi:MAG: hypothetical protein E3J87_09595 [Candidatus Cloacimonadota bacterium]|nr:MAG: hypothetical protein E3J87_09595 [Candidatus Cloacimonadota bacterium]
MADNLTAGNPRAHAVRVYYFGTSTIYEGMPVCYDNSTTNWFGGSVANTGEITVSTTTAEGSQNEGKYIRVENPNADNVSMFAGVVKRGGWVGTTGPSVLDIYIPNGAVVPVRTDSNCLIDQTILAVTTGSQELGVPLVADSRSVAIARETIDRGTAGLVLAELNTSRFVYQDMGGTALSVDDADTTTATMVNHINVKFLGTASTNLGLYCNGTIAGAGACLSGMWYFETHITATPANVCHALGAALCLNGDDAKLASSSGEISAAFRASVWTLGTTAADLSDGDVTAILCTSYIDDGVTTPGSIYGLYFHSSDATYHVFTHLFGVRHALDVGFIAKSSAAVSHVIPISVAGTNYWLMVSNQA